MLSTNINQTAKSNSLAIDNEVKSDMDNFDIGAVCEEEEDTEEAPLGDEDGEFHNMCKAGYTPLTTVGSLTRQLQLKDCDQSRGGGSVFHEADKQ
jgi:hypothetical protein